MRQRLSVAARQRVFFGHQSVGRNILSGVPDVYRSFDLPPPSILEPPAPADASGGFILEAEIGENTEPLRKIADFRGRLNSDIADDVGIALMKLCYVDVTADTDVGKIFRAYRSVVRAVSAEHPGLVLIHVTVPLTTDSREDNVARERLNALMRKQYGAAGRLFDLAKVESTRPDGTRVTGTVEGERYFALYPGYASDSGHLNKVGGRRAATALLNSIAAARD